MCAWHGPGRDRCAAGPRPTRADRADSVLFNLRSPAATGRHRQRAVVVVDGDSGRLRRANRVAAARRDARRDDAVSFDGAVVRRGDAERAAAGARSNCHRPRRIASDHGPAFRHAHLDGQLRGRNSVQTHCECRGHPFGYGRCAGSDRRRELRNRRRCSIVAGQLGDAVVAAAARLEQSVGVRILVGGLARIGQAVIRGMVGAEPHRTATGPAGILSCPVGRVRYNRVRERDHRVFAVPAPWRADADTDTTRLAVVDVGARFGASPDDRTRVPEAAVRTARLRACRRSGPPEHLHALLGMEFRGVPLDREGAVLDILRAHVVDGIGVVGLQIVVPVVCLHPVEVARLAHQRFEIGCDRSGAAYRVVARDYVVLIAEREGVPQFVSEHGYELVALVSGRRRGSDRRRLGCVRVDLPERRFVPCRIAVGCRGGVVVRGVLGAVDRDYHLPVQRVPLLRVPLVLIVRVGLEASLCVLALQPARILGPVIDDDAADSFVGIVLVIVHGTLPEVGSLPLEQLDAERVVPPTDRFLRGERIVLAANLERVPEHNVPGDHLVVDLAGRNPKEPLRHVHRDQVRVFMIGCHTAREDGLREHENRRNEDDGEGGSQTPVRA